MESISFYAVSTTNRSGLIIIAETLFMTWMIIVNLIRLYMRLAINGPVKIDDAVVFTGSVSLYLSPPSRFPLFPSITITPCILSTGL